MLSYKKWRIGSEVIKWPSTFQKPNSLYLERKIDISETPILFNNNDLNGPQDPNNIFKLERVFLDHVNPDHQTYKLLGVHFDEYLNFDKQTSYICSKLARSIYYLLYKKSQ